MSLYCAQRSPARSVTSSVGFREILFDCCFKPAQSNGGFDKFGSHSKTSSIFTTHAYWIDADHYCCVGYDFLWARLNWRHVANFGDSLCCALLGGFGFPLVASHRFHQGEFLLLCHGKLHKALNTHTRCVLEAKWLVSDPWRYVAL